MPFWNLTTPTRPRGPAPLGADRGRPVRVVAVPRWRPRRLATRRPPPVTTLIRKGPRSWRNNATTTLGCVTDYRIVKESGRPAAPPRPGRSGPPASAPRSPRAGLWPGGGAGVLRADGHAPRPEASGLFPTPQPPGWFGVRLDFSSRRRRPGRATRILRRGRPVGSRVAPIFIEATVNASIVRDAGTSDDARGRGVRPGRRRVIERA